MAAFDDEQLAAFFLGLWVKCESSNVEEAMYNSEGRVLTVGFHGGRPEEGIAYYDYLDCPAELAEDFARADSKGKWIDRALKKTGWPFRHSVFRP